MSYTSGLGQGFTFHFGAGTGSSGSTRQCVACQPTDSYQGEFCSPPNSAADLANIRRYCTTGSFTETVYHAAAAPAPPPPCPAGYVDKGIDATGRICQQPAPTGLPFVDLTPKWTWPKCVTTAERAAAVALCKERASHARRVGQAMHGIGYLSGLGVVALKQVGPSGVGVGVRVPTPSGSGGTVGRSPGLLAVLATYNRVLAARFATADVCQVERLPPCLRTVAPRAALPPAAGPPRLKAFPTKNVAGPPKLKWVPTRDKPITMPKVAIDALPPGQSPPAACLNEVAYDAITDCMLRGPTTPICRTAIQSDQTDWQEAMAAPACSGKKRNLPIPEPPSKAGLFGMLPWWGWALVAAGGVFAVRGLTK